MFSLQELKYKINIQPSNLNGNIRDVLKNTIHEKMEKRILNGAYIISICDFKHKQTGVINNDGSVSFNIIVTCQTFCPKIGNEYDLKITHINKMGIMHKYENVSIFVANHHLINDDHKIDDMMKIQIMGKRIEENMVCVAKEIVSS